MEFWGVPKTVIHETEIDGTDIFDCGFWILQR